MASGDRRWRCGKYVGCYMMRKSRRADEVSLFYGSRCPKEMMERVECAWSAWSDRMWYVWKPVRLTYLGCMSLAQHGSI